MTGLIAAAAGLGLLAVLALLFRAMWRVAEPNEALDHLRPARTRQRADDDRGVASASRSSPARARS